ncbi:hypothetical protein [Halomicrobium urmianum]|nr:hypothetical protein [Halomicrobium urmianum]
MAVYDSRSAEKIVSQYIIYPALRVKWYIWDKATADADPSTGRIGRPDE